MQPMKKQTGFTLIELMVATIILVILVSTAGPSLKSTLDRGNFKSIGPFFEKSLKYARSEAIQRGQTVQVRPIINADSVNSFDWSGGWRIEVIVQSDPLTLEVIRTFDSIPGETEFTSDTFNDITPLEISPSGQATLVGSFNLNQAGCKVGKIYTYSVLLSGNLNRSTSPCP